MGSYEVYNFACSIHINWPKDPTRPGNLCGYLWVAPGTETSFLSANVTFGNTANSRDGEVRGMAIVRPIFDLIMEAEFWSQVEDPFLKFIDAASLDTVFYFPPNASPEDRASFKKWVFDSRYDFKLAMANFYYLLELYRESTTKYSPVGFAWLMPDIENLLSIVMDIESKYGPKVLSSSVRNISQAVYAMKIIPITINELRYPNDVRYRVWREVYSQTMCNLVRMSKIATQFTFYITGWEMMHDVDENTFMNPYIRARFQRGEAIEAANKILANIHMPEVGGETITDPYNDDFDTMMRASAGNLIMSNTAIICRSRIATRPFYDGIGNIRDILFDWMYAYLVLHTHFGVIHTDGHLGNIRVQPTNSEHSVVIGTKIYTHHSLYRGQIIDFSRVVINPFFENVMSYTSSAPDVIAREQERHLFDFFLVVFSNHPRVNEVRALIHDDYNRAFHILSILDPIHTLRILSAVITNVDERDFINVLIEKCTSFLEVALRDPSAIDLALYPLFSIIPEVFDMRDYTGTTEQKISLTFPLNRIAQFYISDSNLAILTQIIRDHDTSKTIS
jgi:hypothetical protein